MVLVTSGPGATNTVTGLLTALMDSAPIIVICGQTISPMLGKDAFQEADVTGHHLPRGQALLPGEGRAATSRASCARRSTSPPRAGPGPVLIDLPKDIGQGPCNAPFTDKLDLPGYSVPSRGDPAAIAEAARLLSESRSARCSTWATAP